ncbi:7-cyano-7-deazaguanine synthase [Vibrio alginolyticus]|nr:7-cyano-7-deazaguanine synthase [Vibrio alginolyticus]
MDCDVPFGAFLSGGIDSSCVVALMSEISSKKVNTFSIGFDDKNYNEANISKKIAKKLGTEHYELYAKPSDFFDIIPSLNDFYDEPFSDSSQLPTMLVSKFAREKVTVALSGDSGDELFAGYNRHRMAEQLSSSLTLVNQGLRRGISTAIKTLSSGTYSKISSCLNILTLGKVRISSLGDKAYKFARAFEAKDGYELYRILISTSPEILRKLPKEYLVSSETLFTDDEFSLSEKMMLQDTLSYMCHDILVKVDRASMIYSLESRIPFLDNHVFDTAWRTPIEHKLYKGESKYPLKNLVNKYIGEDISKLPKHGFGVPIAEWLRHDLREWAEQYLCDSALENNEHINPSEVKKIWNLHLSGRENRQYELWNFIILQQWLGRSK